MQNTDILKYILESDVEVSKEKVELIKLLNNTNGDYHQDNINNPTFFEVGKCYLIRTITMIYTGKVEEIRGNKMKLSEGAWIADTERWADCLTLLKEGKPEKAFKEVEPYPDFFYLYDHGILDFVEIQKGPREQK